MLINEGNETIVAENMTFHVRVTVQDVHAKASRGIIAIGETVLIKTDADGAQATTILTSGI